MSALIRTVREHRADAMLSAMVFIWGFHFIVVKDAVADVSPLTYNALRFTVGLVAILPVAWHERAALRLSAHDVWLVIVVGLTGPVLYQIGFAEGIERTTSTNTALLVATMPTWTAVFSILLGIVEIRRRLALGIGMSLVGIALVVLSRSGSGLSLTHDDLIGSLLVLGAAVAGGLSNVVSKPVVDRIGSMPLAIWKYGITTVSLIILASGDLVSLSAETLPASSFPNILYSGILAGAGGFLAVHIGIRDIGPTRSASYFNFTPIVAAFAGILILREPFSAWLLVGGVLTILGVIMVRMNTFLRPHPPSTGAPARRRSERRPVPHP